VHRVAKTYTKGTAIAVDRAYLGGGLLRLCMHNKTRKAVLETLIAAVEKHNNIDGHAKAKLLFSDI